MVSLMSNPNRSEDGRTKNFDLFILITEDEAANPLTALFGASLPVENRHMLASADNAEIVEVFGQVSGKLAVSELVTDRYLIHGKRHGIRKILCEFSVLAFIRILDEVAPQRLGYRPYLFVGFFNNAHTRFSRKMRNRI